MTRNLDCRPDQMLFFGSDTCATAYAVAGVSLPKTTCEPHWPFGPIAEIIQRNPVTEGWVMLALGNPVLITDDTEKTDFTEQLAHIYSSCSVKSVFSVSSVILTGACHP